MIELRHLVFGVTAGAGLMVLGLLPGLFKDLVQGIQNFDDTLSSPWLSTEVEVQQPTWLAGVGAILIVTTVLAYLST